MPCRILLAAVLVAIAPSVQCQTGDLQPELQRPVIRLPEITSRWRQPGQEEGPGITIEEIERCMGQDVAMQGEVIDLKRRQSLLQTEREEIERVSQGMKSRLEALEVRKAALEVDMVELSAEAKNLNQRASLISKKKGAVARSKAEVDKINSLVAAYNADATRHNLRRARLLRVQGDFNKSIEDHNTAVGRVRLDAEAFTAKNDEFRGRAMALTKKSEAFIANCAGERLIRK